MAPSFGLGENRRHVQLRKRQDQLRISLQDLEHSHVLMNSWGSHVAYNKKTELMADEVGLIMNVCYFEVLYPEEARQRQAKSKQTDGALNPGQTLDDADSVHAELFGQLNERRQELEAATEIMHKEINRTEVSRGWN